MQRDDDIAPPEGGEQAPEAARPPARRRPAASGTGAPRRQRAAAGAQPPAQRSNGAVAAAPQRLQARYREEIRPALMREFGYKSIMQAPGVQRVALNMGLGEALTNTRALEMASAQLATISGQKPVITKARRSIANFKLREGMSIGCAVSLRGRRMWEFMDRFLNLALPRIRDFRGVPRRSFDGQGNYSIGIREQLIFPEIDYNTLDRIRGLQVTIVTSARSDHEGFRLLELLGMPFAREGQDR